MPRFQTKPVAPVEVDAIELRSPCTLGKQKGRAGDYLVTHPDNRQQIIAGALFQATFEPAEGNGVPPVPMPAPGTKSVPHVAGDGKRARDPENVKAEAAAKKLWEAGTSVKEIARTVKKSVSVIYGWSSEGKWQRPKPGTAGATQLSGSVRCDHCTVMTAYDPCQHCGKKLTRKWS